MPGMRLNVGCGQTPTPGWENLDNSPSLRIAKVPGLGWLLAKLRILNAEQYRFIRFAREHKIRFANAAKALPLPDHSVEVLYTSHMLEHLDRAEAKRFLSEALRVLQPGGILRIAVPDLKLLVGQYNASGDADALMEIAMLAAEKPRGFIRKLAAAFVGPRHHHWMYDGKSLCKLLLNNGFVDPRPLTAGQTRIDGPGPLDLHERESTSLYVEALAPGSNGGGDLRA